MSFLLFTLPKIFKKTYPHFKTQKKFKKGIDFEVGR